MFPGNRILMIEMLNNFRWEDWDYEYGYAGNRCVPFLLPFFLVIEV